METTEAEIRVLGSLIEKQRTTPDAYPLSVNSLRLACNQATNREPVLHLDERTVRAAAERLGRRGWARFTSGRGSRTPKYRHLLDEALGLSGDELAVLCVLMLRGAQTSGEVGARAERLHSFADPPALDRTLKRLIERELVTALSRRPGHREARYEHRLGGPPEDADRTGTEPDRRGSPLEPLVSSPGNAERAVEDRLGSLEREVGELRASLERLRRELGA